MTSKKRSSQKYVPWNATEKAAVKLLEALQKALRPGASTTVLLPHTAGHARIIALEKFAPQYELRFTVEEGEVLRFTKDSPYA